MRKKLLTLITIAAVAIALPLTASAKKPETGKQATGAKVKIGFINSITGSEASIGENLTNGALMAVDDLRKKGIDVDLIKEDDGSDKQKALLAFEKLTTRDKVTGVVGPYTSGSSEVVASNVDRSGTPLLIPVAAKESLTREGYQYVFRLNAPANVYSSTLMDSIRSLAQIKTVAFVATDDPFGSSTVATAKSYAYRAGLKPVADEKYKKGQPDFRALLSKVKKAKPDIVFMVSYETDAILLMRQAKEIKLTPKAFLGAGAGFTTPEFVNQHEISNGVFAATQWTERVNWPGADRFASEYLHKYGKQPTYHAACAYEAVRIMAESAATAGGDRAKTQAVLKSGSWNGIMGQVKFEDYGGFHNQNRHQMLVLQAQNGVYKTVFPAQFADGKSVFPFSWKNDYSNRKHLLWFSW